jgi:hypothetical protein
METNLESLLIAYVIVVIPIIVAVLVIVRNFRNDILDRLTPDRGTMIKTEFTPRGPITKKAPRIMDDATAAAIEKIQKQRNEGEYRT